MDNHVHLAIEIADVGLPKTMAGLQSSYTQWFNRKYRRVGHLFQGRYKAILVDRESYGQVLIRYIHRNPIEARLVKRDVDYEWSSARAWFRGAGPDWLDLAAGLRLFGSSSKRALAVYRAYRAGDGGMEYADAETAGQQIKGSEEFVESIRRTSDDGRPKHRRVSLENLAREVAREEGVPLASLRTSGKGRKEARTRAIVARRALEQCGLSLAATARFFNKDGSTLVRAVERLRKEGEN